MNRQRNLHLTHWGVFEAVTQDGSLTSVRPYAGDPEPPPQHANVLDAVQHPARVDRPHVRAGWLAGRTGGRGDDAFVPMSWDEALDLVAGQLRRVRTEHGPAAIYGGSYGWGSAGRFHHAQSQIHRFLNCLGGYTGSFGNYSFGASQILLPHVVGRAEDLMARATTWEAIAASTELLVAFGGLPTRNAYVSPGGFSRHQMSGYLRSAKARFVLLSPLRDDLDPDLDPQWLALRPGTDVAVMLALCHVLYTENRHDAQFLRRYTVGFDTFRDYLVGRSDGQPKTPEWAAEICAIPAATLRKLALRMSEHRTFITLSWSLQRAEHGEQPIWAGIVLAAMLGQIGLPGGGFGHGYASSASIGSPSVPTGLPTLPQGDNPVTDFIPVAMVSDMLLHPGEPYDFDGQRRTFPDIRLVYWCGGNPFHHHQDLARLRRALDKPETIVVHEPFWTPMAKHADIVLPATMTVERDDLGAGRNDPLLVAMPRLSDPYQLARDDYNIFTELSRRIGTVQAFTEDRSTQEWLRYLYTRWRDDLAERGHPLPAFDEFWHVGTVALPIDDSEPDLFADFRADPDRCRLDTPSGRIEITSGRIGSYCYPDCPDHPTWLEPVEWLGSALADTYPIQLIANQPAARLHSQLDMGSHSQKSKINGREPIRIHPADAHDRGIGPSDTVRVFNSRGSCLAGAVLSEQLRPGTAQLSTGAWYTSETSEEDPLHLAGNPNVLTSDQRTSRLAQGCAGALTLVQLERSPAASASGS